MILYSLGRKVNKRIKAIKRQRAASYLSPVRRLERFMVPENERIVAMTFDDGPMNLPPIPNQEGFSSSLTQELMDIMKQYQATGTFNIIGSTEENYPDHQGPVGKRSAHGVCHDHYPTFGKDEFAGAKKNGALIEGLIREGHELSNHGYRHILFGKNTIIYGKRECLQSIEEVVADLTRLDQLILSKHKYAMTLSRPPHYIDAIKGGFTSYDAYALMGYDYLAASFDGGGWMPSTGDFAQDIHKMVAPIDQGLKQDANFLNGQIIFQKDGYNMSLMTPVVYALEKQLNILKKHDYAVESVRNLRSKYPFADYGKGGEFFEVAKRLDAKGQIITYKTNELMPEKRLTKGEMLMMTLTKQAYSKALASALKQKEQVKLLQSHPYAMAYQKYNCLDEIKNANQLAQPEEIKAFLYKNYGLEMKASSKFTRGEYMVYLDQLIQNS